MAFPDAQLYQFSKLSLHEKFSENSDVAVPRFYL